MMKAVKSPRVVPIVITLEIGRHFERMTRKFAALKLTL